MLTGYTSLFSVLHAAGSFQCCLLARSCRLPTCSYRFTTPSCSLSTRSCRSLSTCSVLAGSQRLLAGYQHVHAGCQRVLADSQRLLAGYQHVHAGCQVHAGSCALHSHCTNSRSPKMLCILLVGSLSQSLLFDILVRTCLFLEVRWSRSVCWWQSVSPITHFELVNATNTHYDSIALRETD